MMASESEPVPSPLPALLPALLPARALLILLVGIAAVTFAARLIPEPRTIDDAFITFRYSRNLVDGEGFVYNPGARTLGTTTPLYTLLMAGIAFLTGSANYPWFALVVNALADACTAASALAKLVRFRGRAGPLVHLQRGLFWDAALALPECETSGVCGGRSASVHAVRAASRHALF